MQEQLDRPRAAGSSPFGAAKDYHSTHSSGASTAQMGRMMEDEVVAALEAVTKGHTSALGLERVRKAVARLNTLANVPLPPATPLPAPTFDGTPQSRTFGFVVVGAVERPPLRPSLSGLILQTVLSDSPTSPREFTSPRDIHPSLRHYSSPTASRSTSPAPLRLSKTTSSPLLVLSTSPPSHWAQRGVDLDPEELQNWRNEAGASFERNGRKDSWSSVSTAAHSRNSLFTSASPTLLSAPSTSVESRSSFNRRSSSLAPTIRSHLPLPVHPALAPRHKPRSSKRKWDNEVELRRFEEVPREERRRKAEEETTVERVVRWVMGRLS